jgi:hypothetical protein
MMPLVTVAGLAVVFIDPAEAQSAPGWPENRQTLAVYQTATELAAALKDDIWPGYDARKYTFTRSDAGTGQTLVAFSPDPKAARQEVFMSLGGDYFIKHTPEENVLIVFHEAFHAFERDKTRPGARWRYENAFLLFDYAALSTRKQALFAIEGRVLSDALQAATKDEAKKKAREFLAVRRLRQGGLDPSLVEFEKGAESNEGLAEYAGVKAVVAGMEVARQRRLRMTWSFPDAPRYLREKYAPLRTITRIGRNDRLKFYYTGSAQALLLDPLLPGWKGRVQEKAEAVQDLLAEAVGDRPEIADAEAVLGAYDYDTVLKREEEAARGRKAEGEALLRSVLERVGLRVTLDVSSLGQVGDYVSFDPMNVTVLDRGRRLHTRMLNCAQKSCYRAEFEQAVLEDRNRKHYVLSVPRDKNLTLLLDGAPLALDEPVRKGVKKKFVLSAPQVRLEVEAGDVEVTKNGLVVKVRKPSSARDGSSR